MRWYFNDASLQGQFSVEPDGSGEPSNQTDFEVYLRKLLAVRPAIQALHVTRSLSTRPVSPGLTLRAALRRSRNHDLRRAVLIWLDRTGPFIEDDRLPEPDDLFYFSRLDITDSGLGEAARRAKSGEAVCAFSVPGGGVNFAQSPLVIDHGLEEEPYARIPVGNVWSVEELRTFATNEPEPISWKGLVSVARQRYNRLIIPDAVFHNKLLAREPFSEVIGRQALTLLGYLDAYMLGRGPEGNEGPRSQEIIRNFFVGSGAAFTGESESNQHGFRTELTFPRPDGPGQIFAHWHGKIRHRHFRMHFEYPVPKHELRLRVLYLGPKITKE